MIIEWNSDLTLKEWKISRAGISYRENYISIAKITIDENNYVIFWDEFEFCRDIYIQKCHLAINELKEDVDQFLLQMKKMWAFV